MEVIFAISNSNDADEKLLSDKIKAILDNTLEPKEDFYVFCPFCNKMQNMYEYDYDEPPILKCDNLVYPMIWCCCRSVLLPNTVKAITKDEIKIDIINKMGNVTFFSVKLAFIKKMTDSAIGIFECDKAMSDDAAREFSDAYQRECNIHRFISTNEIAKKYHIYLRPFDGDEFETYPDEHERKRMDAKILNLGVVVDSYDVFHPAKPYPSSTDLDHKGVIMRLLCVDENGKEFCTRVCE